MFAEPIHVGRPNLPERERFVERVCSVLDRNWLTNDGPLVREFEERICRSTGAKHSVVMANGTLALALAARSLGIDGEVIMPSFTFVGTAHAMMWQGLTPVFCDVAPDSHTVTADDIRSCVTPLTAAILPVHLWGNVCPTDDIASLGAELKVPVLYDSAHALECGRGGRLVGGFGVAEVFSFHATKFINSFEGGAVTTDDDGLADLLRSMRNFGFAGYDRVDSLGLNAKLPEVSAAMGLSVFDMLSEIVDRNHENRQIYAAGIAQIPGISLLGTSENDKSNLQYVVVEVDQEVAGSSRDVLVESLWAEGVLARRYFTPGCHRSAPYRNESKSHSDLSTTERLCREVMVLPTGLAVTGETVRTIVDLTDQILSIGTRRPGAPK